MGMDDYIQYVLPNDSISVEGEFITYQSFRPHSAIGRGDSDDEDSIVKIIGLWMLAMDSRDSLADVLKRLLACIREGRSYPEEYRYAMFSFCSRLVIFTFNTGMGPIAFLP